jgi:phage shock protein PspC (stress-responsive transcriptional regulator)
MTDTTTKGCSSCFKDIDSRATRCPFCAQRQSDVVGFYRDVPGRALGGVTAAIAQHFNWDVTLMRIAFVASLAITGGLVFWVYFAAWVMTPFHPTDRAPLVKLTDKLGTLFSPNRGAVERV